MKNKGYKIIAFPGADNNCLKSNSYRKTGSRKPNPKEWMLVAFILLSALYFLFSIIKSIDIVSRIDSSLFPVLNTVFLSILIQALPFLLLGVLVASTIQVLISSETIARIFPRNSVFGFIVAMLAGVFFPVCDCAVVPVAAGLVKRGVPLPAAVTFLLAAPIVNPIVIASTWYAFPDQPHMALFRVYFGLIIALAAGLMFRVLPAENVLLSNSNSLDLCTSTCSCCSSHVQTTGFGDKIGMIFRHAVQEFFQVGKFLIFGALLSSALQVLVPKDIFYGISGTAVSILIMMIAAFILSVCSTSDAFIARTFVNQFPMGAVMGFMILGPMLDIKNVLMLLSSFQKRFVVKLVLIIFSITFVVMLIVSPWLN